MSASTIHPLPTVDEIGDAILIARETGNFHLELVCLDLIKVHVEILAEEIGKLPDLPAGDLPAA